MLGVHDQFRVVLWMPSSAGPAVVERWLFTRLPHKDRLRINAIMLWQQVHSHHARVGVTIPVTYLLERPRPPSWSRQQGLFFGVAFIPPPKPLACQPIGIIGVEFGHVI